MKFTKNQLKYKLELSKEVIDLIIKYQEKLPVLAEEGEGFCVNARDLHRELGVGRDFSTWIKGRIDKYNFTENEDYNIIWEKGSDTKTGDALNSNQMTALGYSKEYKLTINMAKELSMVENNNNGRIARKYFIHIEKALKDLLDWNRIREPEKEGYKEMCIELDKYFQRNLNKRPQFYDYSNEADAINLICLEAKAKDIREYINIQDKQTREYLNIEFNTYLSKLQELNSMYLKMNLDKNRRYDLIKQGFKALYSNASFFMANKNIKRAN